ncbi:MAG: hypothetical protein Q8L66_12430 [Caulobacter sp.]|nr:hypothetical protein [Caulobacter sp.]
MVVHGLGAALIARLMRAGRAPDLECDWLLFGPSDPEVVEVEQEAPPPLLLAAE